MCKVNLIYEFLFSLFSMNRSSFQSMATTHNSSLLMSSTSSNSCNSTITGTGSLSGSNTTSSPCAACKFLRRKCQPDCVFAPYFPPDNPTKFQNVHKVFGASNVTKLLNDLQPYQREDAVNSLAYEADMRLRDPVYGCVGVISVLQHELRQLQLDLLRARTELSRLVLVFHLDLSVVLISSFVDRCFLFFLINDHCMERENKKVYGIYQ